MTPSNSSFVVWGAGGHGKVVADLVRACGHSFLGFVDRDCAKLAHKVESEGASVVLLEKDFLQRIQQSGRTPAGADAVAVALGENRVRQRALDSLDACRVPALLHPSATVSPSATLGRGTVVLGNAVINAEARIGRGVIVNSAAVVEHDCVVADATHLSPGAILAGCVRVGERAWIGAGATVIQGVQIGADVIVGAGAVVIRDVADGSVVAGVPARPLHGP